MHIDFPTREYAGYIFDLDGTLIDSMPAHYRAWIAGLRAAGFTHEFSEDYFYSLGGVPTARIVDILNQRHGVSMDPLAVAHAKEDIYLKLLPEIRPIAPVVEFARERAAAGKPLAIASGGMRRVVDAALKAAGLSDLFPLVVTPEDVTHGKPSPEMFLLAAKKMGVAPADAIVFEDAELGRQAAVAAGMDYVLVPTVPQKAVS